MQAPLVLPAMCLLRADARGMGVQVELLLNRESSIEIDFSAVEVMSRSYAHEFCRHLQKLERADSTLQIHRTGMNDFVATVWHVADNTVPQPLRVKPDVEVAEEVLDLTTYL